MAVTQPAAHEPTLGDIDLTDMDRFAESFPHEWFTLLRREAPVWFHEPTPEIMDGDGFWVVTKYDDVVAVSRDWQTFSSEKSPSREGGGIMISDASPEFGVGNMMLMMDPPKHTRYRKIVMSAFTPACSSSSKPRSSVAPPRSSTRCASRDRATSSTTSPPSCRSRRSPRSSACRWSDRKKLFDWTNAMVGSTDPEYVFDEADVMNAQVEMFTYANELAVEKRARPTDDIVTAILNAEVDGERLDELEFDLFFMLLTVAGNETTRNAITHGMLAFFENPDQWQRLHADRSLMSTAVDEVVRWASPVIYFRRSVTRDTEIRGQKIKEGDKVTIWYPSANRDEDVFRDPFTFDVGRTPNDHLGFGGRGPHFCLGSNLAKMEMSAIYNELLDRMPDLAFAGAPARLRSNFINGIKRLPVTYSPSKPVLT